MISSPESLQGGKRPHESSTAVLGKSTGQTCLACKLVFSSGLIQRDHYRTDWHLYNVKRQVASLPPVSEHDFRTKLQQYTQVSSGALGLEDQNAVPADASGALLCSVCGNKKFRSRNAYDNHLNSRKHNENEKKQSNGMEKDKTPAEKMKEEEEQNAPNLSDLEEVYSDSDQDEQGIASNECLFCQQQFENWQTSLQHMTLQHGFSIPDLPYCSDVPGLLEYLGFKIGAGLTCIRCQCTRFRTLEDLRKHMRDSNHCNFRIDDKNDKGENDALLEFMDFYDYGRDEEDTESENPCTTLYEEDGFLVLPSGARIGHRSLMRYFRQKLRPVQENNTPSNAAKISGRTILKQLGSSSGTSAGPLALARARDFAFIKRTIERHRLSRDLASNKLFVSRGRKDQM